MSPEILDSSIILSVLKSCIFISAKLVKGISSYITPEHTICGEDCHSSLQLLLPRERFYFFTFLNLNWPWIKFPFWSLDSSSYGILQARILQWIAISFSRECSWLRDQILVSCVSCIGRPVLYQLSHQRSPTPKGIFKYLQSVLLTLKVGQVTKDPG